MDWLLTVRRSVCCASRQGVRQQARDAACRCQGSFLLRAAGSSTVIKESALLARRSTRLVPMTSFRSASPSAGQEPHAGAPAQEEGTAARPPCNVCMGIPPIGKKEGAGAPHGVSIAGEGPPRRVSSDASPADRTRGFTPATEVELVMSGAWDRRQNHGNL